MHVWGCGDGAPHILLPAARQLGWSHATKGRGSAMVDVVVLLEWRAWARVRARLTPILGTADATKKADMSADYEYRLKKSKINKNIITSHY